MLIAALNAKESDYSEEQCRKIINEKVENQINKLKNDIRRVVKKERDVLLNPRGNPT